MTTKRIDISTRGIGLVYTARQTGGEMKPRGGLRDFSVSFWSTGWGQVQGDMKIALILVLFIPVTLMSSLTLMYPHLDVVLVVEGEPVVHASWQRDHVSLSHLYPHPTLIFRAHVEVTATYVHTTHEYEARAER